MRQYREYCKGARRRNAPRVPRPFGLRPKRAPALSRILLMRPGLGLAQRGAGRGAERRVAVAVLHWGFCGCSRERACG